MSDPNHPAKDDRPPYDPRQIAKLAAVMGEARHPKQIGPYRILEIVGEGGMGSVYKAEQDEPIKRTVAIKIIKLGMDTRAVLARFEAERKALAMMDHPNVARVLDAGTTDAGLPYFVMEFVDGKAITEYADANRLSVGDRLGLVSQACLALQHAHQKAIIHRDIKPSNILVTTQDGSPLVKVIDFGVAKAIEQSKTQQTLFTEVGQIVGTPEYMSPEQADAGQDVDTRTDVYSMGVVLFELLSGALPFDSKTLRAAGYGELCRIIREVEPPRPSAKLSGLDAPQATSVAERRQLLPSTLGRQLRSELDWIVLKAISKDRDRRYATAAEFDEDLSNYRMNRPVRAGPESNIYRARKFVRRNRSGVIAATSLVASLAVGLVATAWQAQRAIRAERAIRIEKVRADELKDKAEQANSVSTQMNEFLISMLQSADPRIAQGDKVLVTDVLDRASSTVGEKFVGQPLVEARLRFTLGETYISLGEYKSAIEQCERSMNLHRSVNGPDDPDALESQTDLTNGLQKVGRLEESLALSTDLVERYSRTLGATNSLTLGSMNNLAVKLQLLGRYDEAESKYRAVRNAYLKQAPPEANTMIRNASGLGQLLKRQGKVEESLPLLQECYERRVALLGNDHPDTIISESEFADTLRILRRLPEAELHMRDAFERSSKVLGDDHPDTIFKLQGLAMTIVDQGRMDEGFPLYKQAVDKCRSKLGNDDKNTLMMLKSYASALTNAGRLTEGEAAFVEVAARFARVMGEDNPETVNANWNYARCLQRDLKLEAALPLFKRIYEQVLEPGRIQFSSLKRAQYLTGYGIVLAQLERPEAKGHLIVARDALAKEDEKNPAVVSMQIDVVRMLRQAAVRASESAEVARWETELALLKSTLQLPTSNPVAK